MTLRRIACLMSIFFKEWYHCDTMIHRLVLVIPRLARFSIARIFEAAKKIFIARFYRFYTYKIVKKICIALYFISIFDYIPSLPKPNFPGPSLPGHFCPSPSLPRPKFARSQICPDPSLPRPNLPKPNLPQR